MIGEMQHIVLVAHAASLATRERWKVSLAFTMLWLLLCWVWCTIHQSEFK